MGPARTACIRIGAAFPNALTATFSARLTASPPELRGAGGMGELRAEIMLGAAAKAKAMDLPGRDEGVCWRCGRAGALNLETLLCAASDEACEALSDPIRSGGFAALVDAEGKDGAIAALRDAYLSCLHWMTAVGDLGKPFGLRIPAPKGRR